MTISRLINYIIHSQSNDITEGSKIKASNFTTKNHQEKTIYSKLKKKKSTKKLLHNKIKVNSTVTFFNSDGNKEAESGASAPSSMRVATLPTKSPRAPNLENPLKKMRQWRVAIDFFFFFLKRERR